MIRAYVSEEQEAESAQIELDVAPEFGFEGALFSPSLDAVQEWQALLPEARAMVQICRPKRSCDEISFVPGKCEADVFAALPDEIAICIFSSLGHKDVLGLRLVCKRFAQLAGDDEVWKKLCLQRWTKSVFRFPPPNSAISWMSHYQNLSQTELDWLNTANPTTSQCLRETTSDTPLASVTFFRADIASKTLVTIASGGAVQCRCLTSLEFQRTLCSVDEGIDPRCARLSTCDGVLTVSHVRNGMAQYCVRTGTHLRDIALSTTALSSLWGLFALSDGSVLSCHGRDTVHRYTRAGAYRDTISLTHGPTSDPFFFVTSHTGSLFTAHQSGRVCEWAADSGELRSTLPCHTAPCLRVEHTTLRSGKSVIVSAALDGTLVLTDAVSGVLLDTVHVRASIDGLCVGSGALDTIVVSTRDRATRSENTGLYMWRIVGQRFVFVRHINCAQTRRRFCNSSCMFDGARVLYTRNADAVISDGMGLLEVVTLATLSSTSLLGTFGQRDS